MWVQSRLVVGLAVAVVLAGCTTGDPEPPATQSGGAAVAGSPSAPGQEPTPSKKAPDPPDADEGPEPEDVEPDAGTQEPRSAAHPISVPGLAEQRHRGDRLRLGAVRERTSEYTSYDVTYRSRTTTRRGEEVYTISGVLNVPNGDGEFPGVVLAHGYIDPTLYQSGQGMTRERGFLAARGYIAFHVDYRNHGESDGDPRYQVRMRLGYSADVINAVKALRDSPDVPVDDERVAFFGRSMGTGVVLKALIAEPGLVGGAALWASVSSLESENYDRFIRPDPGDRQLRDELSRRHGTPEENPRFWRENSSRPYFDRITEPVLMVHGRLDDTCPPRWASATRRALDRAGVQSRLEWYRDGHAFGPAFNAAMNRTVLFLDRRLD